MQLAGRKLKALRNRTSHYEVVDGVLYRKETVRGQQRKLLYVPDVDELRVKELKRAHGEKGATEEGKHADAGQVHEGAEKMEALLLRDRYWPGLRRDCKNKRKYCHWCKTREEVATNAGLLAPSTSQELKGKRRIVLDLTASCRRRGAETTTWW